MPLKKKTFKQFIKKIILKHFLILDYKLLLKNISAKCSVIFCFVFFKLFVIN